MNQITCYKSPQHLELVLTVRRRVNYGEPYLHIANENGVSAALVRKVDLFGVDSKKLRKAMGIVSPPRYRLNIDLGDKPELKARFDAQRGGMSRGEYLARLLELEVKA